MTRPGARFRGSGRAGGAIRLLLVSVILLGGVAVQGVASPVRAAEDELALVSSASYRLDPEAAVVRVLVDVTATNNKPNRVETTSAGVRTTRYFYDAAAIAVHAEAADIAATSGGSRLTTKVTPDEGFTVVEVRFRTDLYYKQSTTFTLSYTLPGGAPRSDSDIRVGSAFATFYAWAFGDRGDVLVVVPDGFQVETTGSEIVEVPNDAGTSYAATGISNVTDWYVVVVADRHDALTQERLDLEGGEKVVVRAWPEDEEWRTRVADLLSIGLPVLVDKVGLPWPVEGEIEVAEVHTPLLEGYAGVFYTDRDLIEISEDLDELTIIHEASHAWFNARLFVGRWINEGFADEYAARVLDEVSVGGLRPDSLTPGSEGNVRLNEWSHPGRIADEETDAREHFGYEASWTVIRELLDEIGEEEMRAVFAAANAETTAYVGAGEPEIVTYGTDWRRFLDLLEEAAGSRRAVDLFRRWVIAPDQEALIAEREAARAAYAALVDKGNGWAPGYVVRDPMGRWQFSKATEEIHGATEILAVRDEIRAIAERLSVAPPDSLQNAYEAADEDLGPVRKLADRQLAAATALEEATRVVTAERDAFTTLGLLGEDPAAVLTAAAEAFTTDEIDTVTERSAAVVALVEGADDAGRTRAAVGGGVAVGLAGLGVLGVMARRRRRTMAALTADGATGPDGPATVAAGPDAPATVPPAFAPPGPEAADPYATLGGQRTDEPAAAPSTDQPAPPPETDNQRGGGEDS